MCLVLGTSDCCPRRGYVITNNKLFKTNNANPKIKFGENLVCTIVDRVQFSKQIITGELIDAPPCFSKWASKIWEGHYYFLLWDRLAKTLGASSNSIFSIFFFAVSLSLSLLCSHQQATKQAAIKKKKLKITLPPTHSGCFFKISCKNLSFIAGVSISPRFGSESDTKARFWCRDGEILMRDQLKDRNFGSF